MIETTGVKDEWQKGLYTGLLLAIATCKRIMESRQQEREEAKAHGRTCDFLLSEGTEISIVLENAITTTSTTLAEPKVTP